MAEKSRCIDCGRSIVRITAEVRGGRCLTCYRSERARVIPDDFCLPAELQGRVAESELDSCYLRRVAWTEGVGQVESMLRLEQETSDLKRVWKPKLVKLADEGRQRAAKEHSSIPEAMLSEMRRILASKLGEGPTVHPLRVGICSLPEWAIDLAETQWASNPSSLVLLTPDARSAWDSLYKHPEDAFWWFSWYQWRLEDFPSRISEADGSELWEQEEVPDECEPWLVHSGEALGPLAGHGNSELWIWNGSEASYLRTVTVWVS